MLHYHPIFLCADYEAIASMQSFECCLPSIDIVVTLSKLTIEKAYGIDFLYFVIFLTQTNMLCYCLACPVEDTLEVVELTR